MNRTEPHQRCKSSRPQTGIVLVCTLVLTGVACAVPPPPPEGFQWEKQAAFTDEFNQDQLDTGKWYDHHPRWRGRPPALFMPNSVSVQDGHMQIRNSLLPEAVKARAPAFTIAGGAVVSRSPQASFGYYEARIKASSISMSSTFWFSSDSVRDHTGARISTELDVVELIGQTKRGSDSRNFMRSNSHYWYRPRGNKNPPKPDQKVSRQKSGHCPITPPANEAFHTYACWWVDTQHARIYLNDEYQFTLTFDTTYSPTPFDRPMSMNMVTETYDWETPPTSDELADDQKNTTYYDWVRAWKLVPATPTPKE